ncbi:MAG: 3-hydroxyacyl-CoA dehydrogenase [Hydrocarboniphaga sp.]|uniref:3-hydroxyacyl-CoA dehydrogenase NAD-binding domain-containing protein n=1 Tax=Hydrocarboniphaga sp. TaxID=2033016 RepID=UPI002615FDA3|nr:3-hydroxyacyl-CoA dehydrogenase NAD-binding domain-containing protein [Hydrocarboniphaga sp.]MDB5967727.1 3-hydroxyacyl-CoA dehydrogenase [Hydrocarboniphaga sp.]
MNNLTLAVGDDGIALISIDLAGRPMNVLTPELLNEFDTAVRAVLSDATIKGAVLTSAKPGQFVAGADLKDFVNAYDNGMTAAQAAADMQAFHKTTRAMETGGKPFAAALPGLALGGGLELALACHYRVLADDPKAVVGLPEVTVGLLPGGGGTQRLPRLIGVAPALQMMLTGAPAKPTDALKLGIVHALAPVDEIAAKARAWVLANPAAQQPWDRKGFVVPGGAGPTAPFANQVFMGGVAQIRRQYGENVPAPLAIMSAVFEGTITGFDTGLRVESKYFGKLLSGPVARNLMRTMFVNKGIADKLGRRPREVPKSQVKKLGVLGAGMMGAGIAYVAAQAGIEVVLIDATQAAADNGKAYSEKMLAKALQKNATTPERSAALLARITPTTDYAKLEGCDLVVEAVFESREVKKDVTQKAEAVIPFTAIFASNTSTLPITGLSKASKRPAQFIGLHFFSPVDRMPLLEVIMGEHTGQETLAKALDFAAQMKKTPIVVNDGPGFYTSRVFATFIDEGACMLLEGVEPALIENAAKMAGMPVGPLAQFDEVSQELSWKIIQQARTDGLAEQYLRNAAAPAIEKLIRLDRKGRRYAGGFYEYPKDGGKKFLWPGLKEHFPPKAEQPAAEELRIRFLTIQALEAARCLEEGVITDPADADIGAVFGIGYPQWTGGTLSYVDTVGIQRFVADCERFAAAYGPRFQPSAWLKARAQKEQGFYPKLSAQPKAA